MKEAEDSFIVDHTFTLLLIEFLITKQEAKDSSPFTLLLSEFLITKQEAKDSSPFILLLSEFLIPKKVMRGKRFLPMCIYYSTSFQHLRWI